MTICKKCLLPTSRPGVIVGEDGICNACTHQEKKEIEVDWEEREQLLIKKLQKYKHTSNGYDCLIPVSGGKDSTWQVKTMLDYGLKPLAVTFKCPNRSQLGNENLENLINLGVDHIDFTYNPKIEKSLMYEVFKKSGAVASVDHLSIFSLMYSIALKFDIKLIIWAENAAVEYGGSGDVSESVMNINWIRKYGSIHDLDDESFGLTQEALINYKLPLQSTLDKAGIEVIFLGWFLNWDPNEVTKIAKSVGFKVPEVANAGLYNSNDLDCDVSIIHDFMKYYKFGTTRRSEQIALEVRKGRITTEDAKELLQTDEPYPKKSIQNFCTFLEISEKEFWEVCESFRNDSIWEKDIEGKWFMPFYEKELKIRNNLYDWNI